MKLITWPQAKIDFFKTQGFSPTTLIRFWKYVRITPRCWLWEGTLRPDGYGVIGIRHQTVVRTHVLSWMIYFGPILKGLCVLHNCPEGDNPACVNPAHLWLGTKKQNTRDMVKKGRSAKGEKHGMAKLSESQVLKIRELYELGYFQREIAEQFEISPALVSCLTLRKNWTHI